MRDAVQRGRAAQAYTILVIGSGLTGASAAASLGELGYRSNASAFRIHHAARTPSTRRGHQRRQNYQNDDGSIYRLFYDTVKLTDMVFYIHLRRKL